ncbi:MAG: hypothetical protein GX945_05195 [Lentisphaerae bacterium]|jgi:hypothetical protein|nr:hypothetical protein [Lentisphaerota bacterium]
MYAKILCCALLLSCSALLAEEFLLRIVLVNSHTEDVWLGCKAGASKKYDRGEDIFAPPPGMQTGMVTMPSPGGKLPTLYRDIRAPELPQSWELNCRPHPGKAIELSWDSSELPANLTLTMTHHGKTLNMREVSTLSIAQSTTVVVTASAKTAAETAAPADAAANGK